MKKFPARFTWGTSTSSYQIEGAWLEGGKGLSIWDAFSHTPGKIRNNETADVTCDHYHRYKEDVALLAEMGLKAYRFSLSWPRIQPGGKGKINKQGIRFYSDLIDALLDHGITPWVTLYHWDLPISLEFEHHGWLDPQMAGFFADYASVCFENFGDRVKHWITLNEPWVASILGYGYGIFAPGRASNVEPYHVAHQLLRAHGEAVRRYRDRFQAKQGGIIGMANNCDWREPRTDSEPDRAAAQRALEFFLGWFADPVHWGDYPEVMRSRVKDRLPRFSDRDRSLIKGSTDFFGLNHYTTFYATQAEKGSEDEADFFSNAGIRSDQDVNYTTDPAWDKTEMGWSVVPWGCRKLLEWIDRRYDRPAIVLTENGCALPDRLENGSVHDEKRIEYHTEYLTACHRAIESGVDLRGYFIWSFLDNYEWTFGYSKRFGLHYVDFSTKERVAKDSAKWYADVIRNNGF